MVPKLYMIQPSAPVRSVLMAAKALNVQLELKEVDLLNKEHLTPEYLKINPTHTVPTLDDNGFIVVDSHAIMTYIAQKYGNDDSLYPKDVEKRTIVDSRLHFDSGTLFARMTPISRSIIFNGEKTISQKNIDYINESYGFVEAFLENSKFIAGDFLSLADFSFISTLTSWDLIISIDSKMFPKVTSYIKRMKTLPFYSENIRGLGEMKALVAAKLES